MSSPSAIEAPRASGAEETQSIRTPGTMFSRNAVGPTTKKNSARPRASSRVRLDSHRMPRATPDTAEKMVPIVSTTMIASPSIRRAPTESLRGESPNSGAMIELISGTRPRRKEDVADRQADDGEDHPVHAVAHRRSSTDTPGTRAGWMSCG